MLDKVETVVRKTGFLLVVFLVVGVLSYGLGLGPFREDAAKGAKPEAPRERSVSISVKVEKVRRGDLEEKIASVGPLEADAAVMVAPRLSARLAAVFVEVGDKVESGQLLGRLDQHELAQDVRAAEASLRVARATLAGKEVELKDLKLRFERAHVLLRKDFISRQEVDTLATQVQTAEAGIDLAKAQVAQMQAQLDNARIVLADTEVKAPFSGYIGKRFVDPGAQVSPSTPIVSVLDIARVKVVIPVTEADYRRVQRGDRASVAVDAYPGRTFPGRVARMAPVLSRETRTAEVEIELTNPGAMLKPGMFARVEIVIQEHRGVLLVPDGALVKLPRGYGIFKVEGEASQVKLVRVEPKLGQEGWTEVQGQLKAGDRVVTVGSNLLRDGQKVSVAEASTQNSAVR